MSALRKLADQTAIYGLSSIVARLLSFWFVNVASIIPSIGQNSLAGEYSDSRQKLVLRPDSSFSYTYRLSSFGSDQAWGTWSVRNGLVRLVYIDRLDTFITVHTRQVVVNGQEYEVSMESRTLCPSMSEDPVTVHGSPPYNCAQGRGHRPTILVPRKNRLHAADESGRIVHTKVRSNRSGLFRKRWKRTYFIKN